MAFTKGNTLVKKDNYAIFISLTNASLTYIDALTTNEKGYLLNFPTNPTQTVTTGNIALTNASTDIVVTSSGTFSSTASDNKLRFCLNLATKAVGAYYNNTAVLVNQKLFPIGICLAEAYINEEKGEEVKLLDGGLPVISKTISFEAILPSIQIEQKNFINSLPVMGVLFKSLSTTFFAYVKDLVPFMSLTVKSNALNQMVLSASKEVGATDSIITMGD